jgi:hypothetical protein
MGKNMQIFEEYVELQSHCQAIVALVNYLRSEERAKQLSQRLPKKSVLADWLADLTLNAKRGGLISMLRELQITLVEIREN